MSHHVPQAPRVVPLMLAAFAAGSSVPLSGQEIPSAVPGRLDGQVDTRISPEGSPRLDPGASETRSNELELKLAISAAYDDNIYLSARNAESDLVTRVAPSVAYRTGDKLDGEGGYLSVAYRPTVVAYAENSSNDRIEQEASWEAGWRGKAIRFAYSGTSRQLGDATADTGTLTDRSEVSNSVRIAWSLREKITVELAAGHDSTGYDSSAFADSSLTYGEVALRYAYSPKTRLGLIYKAGTFEVDGSGEQTVNRATARIEWNPTRKISVDVEAGFEHRSFDNGSDTTPVVEARVGWQPREGTEIYLKGYRREEASAFLAGQNYTQGGVALGISQRLGGKWTGKLEAGLERAEYSRVSGTGPAGRVDRIRFIRPSLEYRFTDDFSMGLYYRYSENRSNNPAFGYENHSAGVEMGYQF
jgi:hypothetical protein